MSEEELLDATYEGWRLGFDTAVDVVRELHREALARWKDVPVGQVDLRAVKRAKVSALAGALRKLGVDE